MEPGSRDVWIIPARCVTQGFIEVLQSESGGTFELLRRIRIYSPTVLSPVLQLPMKLTTVW
jgi:hypothetical protein